MDGHDDRYPFWITRPATAFKLFVPPALAEWLPAEYARANMEILQRQGDMLRRLGMKGYLLLNDPMYLPEGVYQAHPEWRGPQCELPYLTDRPYWAPCVDNAEVLDLYRQALTEICKAAPIDLLVSSCNDAGSGICWDRTYPGPNGNAACAHRMLWDRLNGFMDALADGAREAGAEVSINLLGTTSSHAEFNATLTHIKSNYAIRGKSPDGRPWVAGASQGGPWGDHALPVVGIEQPVQFIEELEQGFGGDSPRVSTGMSPELRDFGLEVLSSFRDSPTSGPVSRMNFLLGLAESKVGKDDAEDLVQCWLDIVRAMCILEEVVVAGFGYLLLAVITQKWLIRPLVPNPARLTEDEKRPFLRAFFHARTAADAEDFRNILGQPSFIGNSAVSMAARMLSRCISRVSGMQSRYAKLENRASLEMSEHFALQAKRLGALVCLVTNVKNTIEYQHEMQRVRATQTDYYLPGNLGPSPVSKRPIPLRNIARAEIDNINELVALLESTDAPLIELSATPDEEDHLCYGSDLAEQLRKKVNTMLALWDENPQPLDAFSGPEEESETAVDG